MKHQIGPHTVGLDGDLVELTLTGLIAAEHMPRVLQLIDSMNGGSGSCYVFADLRGVESVSPDARRIASKWPGVRRVRGIAIVGASLVVQTLVLLVSRANTLLSGTTKTAKVAFFKSDSEARAWLQKTRAEEAA